MMRTECLPDLQERLTTALRNRLRTMLTCTLFVLITAVVALCALFLAGNHEADIPIVIGPDGHSHLSWAISVTPSLVICEGDAPDGVQLSFHETDRIPLTKVRASALPSGAKITLLRLGTPVPDQPVPVIIGAENAQRALMVGPNQEKWEGVLMERKAPSFEPQPAITLPSGLPVFSAADRSLVGITVQSREGVTVVSMTAVVSLFPEIKSGQ